MTNFTQTREETSFLFKGNINEVVRAISTQELLNLSIEEPDLEEIFMHYYGKAD